MKNKKYLTVGVAVILSGLLLVATALTGNAAGNAYEQFKLMLREDHPEIDSMTIHMNMDISDNGQVVFSAAGDMKTDKSTEKMSGKFQISGLNDEKSFEIFHDSDEVLFHLDESENWYKAASPKPERDDDDEMPRNFKRRAMKENHELREMFMDTLMGDLKDQVELVEANGLRTFSLTLDEGNMPVLLKTAFSAGKKMHRGPECPDVTEIEKLPVELQNMMMDMKGYRNLIDISGDRTLKQIKILLTVDQNNQPQAMAFSTSFSGVSEDGTEHDYVVNCNMQLSDINATSPEVPNVDPASIITIDTTQFEHPRNCHRNN